MATTHFDLYNTPNGSLVQDMITWRNEIAGDNNSNMQKIDAAMYESFYNGVFLTVGTEDSTNSYVATNQNIDVYQQGMLIMFVPLASNSGPATLVINELPSKTIKKMDAGIPINLVAGDLSANSPVLLMLDDTNETWIVTTSAGGGGGEESNSTITPLIVASNSEIDPQTFTATADWVTDYATDFSGKLISLRFAGLAEPDVDDAMFININNLGNMKMSPDFFRYSPTKQTSKIDVFDFVRFTFGLYDEYDNVVHPAAYTTTADSRSEIVNGTDYKSTMTPWSTKLALDMYTSNKSSFIRAVNSVETPNIFTATIPNLYEDSIKLHDCWTLLFQLVGSPDLESDLFLHVPNADGGVGLTLEVSIGVEQYSEYYSEYITRGYPAPWIIVKPLDDYVLVPLTNIANTALFGFSDIDKEQADEILATTRWVKDQGYITPDGNVVTSINGMTGDTTLLDEVENFGIATQQEAEEGTASDKYMTPERTLQAINANASAPAIAIYNEITLSSSSWTVISSSDATNIYGSVEYANWYQQRWPLGGTDDRITATLNIDAMPDGRDWEKFSVGERWSVFADDGFIRFVAFAQPDADIRYNALLQVVE